MASILISGIILIYDFIINTMLGFFDFNMPTLMDYIFAPIKILNSFIQLAPITFGSIKQMINIFIVIFFSMASIWGVLKAFNLFLPNPFIKSSK